MRRKYRFKEGSAKWLKSRSNKKQQPSTMESMPTIPSTSNPSQLPMTLQYTDALYQGSATHTEFNPSMRFTSPMIDILPTFAAACSSTNEY